jgi:hypothetical protein
MANLITARKTYATVANAEKALAKVIATASEGLTLEDVRYFIAVSATEPGRFVPTVMLQQPKMVGGTACWMIHCGIMVVG